MCHWRGRKKTCHVNISVKRKHDRTHLTMLWYLLHLCDGAAEAPERRSLTYIKIGRAHV